MAQARERWVNYDLSAYDDREEHSWARSEEEIRAYWERIEAVFGPEGMPSCGLTDARRLGAVSDEKETVSTETVYIGAKND